jgi:pyroglutamyl-peptidase
VRYIVRMPARPPVRSPARATVLLTGFDPFGGAPLNASWLAVQALHGRQVLRRRVVAVQLPTVFGDALRVLGDSLDRLQPELVVCVGQAGGRAAISLERAAINVDDAPIRDNTGAQPVDRPVVDAGPAAYFSTLPIKSMHAALHRQGLPAEVSQSAGTFVCNHVFYGLMHRLATDPGLRHARGGFVHVPWLPEQGVPNMPLGNIVRGLRVAVRCALECAEEVPAPGSGTIH